MKAELRKHLRLTTQEAVARLQGRWAADVAAYDAIHEHALHMADLLSTGLIRVSGSDSANASDGRGREDRMNALNVATVGVVEPGTALTRRPPVAFADAESREWLRSLRAEGATRDEAIARLHALLLRAARFEVARRRPAMPHVRGDELDDIATEAADDALMSVLRRLDDFRGASRFTTWVYKFALLEAAVKLRKRAWQGREVPLEPESWSVLASAGLGPAAEVEQSELLSSVRTAIDDVLTPHQRRVLIALAVNGVPIDVLADRLDSTRGALYKTLHDARRKLRAHLEERGLLDARLEEGS